MGKFGSFIQIGMALGYMLVLGFGLGLPDADYNPAIKNDPENDKAL